MYDFDTDDIVNFLCTYGISEGELQNLIGKPVECNPQFAMFNLNYPSIGIGHMNGPMSVYRTVTYKGKENDPKFIRLTLNILQGWNSEWYQIFLISHIIQQRQPIGLILIHSMPGDLSMGALLGLMVSIMSGVQLL